MSLFHTIAGAIRRTTADGTVPAITRVVGGLGELEAIAVAKTDLIDSLRDQITDLQRAKAVTAAELEEAREVLYAVRREAGVITQLVDEPSAEVDTGEALHFPAADSAPLTVWDVVAAAVIAGIGGATNWTPPQDGPAE